jgi:hypothetical protein
MVLYVVAALVMGAGPGFDATGAEIAAHLDENRWVGWLAAIAALLYPLRVGTLFSTEGAFAADGVLGLYVPVAAVAAWIFIASVVLASDLRAGRAARPAAPPSPAAGP